MGSQAPSTERLQIAPRLGSVALEKRPGLRPSLFWASWPLSPRFGVQLGVQSHWNPPARYRQGRMKSDTQSQGPSGWAVNGGAVGTAPWPQDGFPGASRVVSFVQPDSPEMLARPGPWTLWVGG